MRGKPVPSLSRWLPSALNPVKIGCRGKAIREYTGLELCEVKPPQWELMSSAQ